MAIEKAGAAAFITPFNRLTEQGLFSRLAIGRNRLMQERIDLDFEIEPLRAAVHEFWRNTDHGLEHSRQVFDRALLIIRSCPNLLRHCNMHGISLNDTVDLLKWAAILHDFTRFAGYPTLAQHQRAGSNLAYYCFKDEIFDHLGTALFNMLVHHDYICEFVNGEQLPKAFIDCPLAEIFRLADKTSLPPAKELIRYHKTGTRVNAARPPNETAVSFFDPNLTFEQRFNHFDNHAGWDFLNYFLLLFAIQPSDWFYGETRDLYREWQEKTGGGKSTACAKILELAAAEGLDGEKIFKLSTVLDAFFRKFNLPNYIG